VRPWAIALLVVEFVQIAVGLTQARMGLPALLVGIHMVLACLLVAAMTATVLSLRARTPALEGRAL
jgi:heme a synthase